VTDAPEAPPLRVLFVFGWLVVGGEETEVRHLARLLPRDRYRLEVVACFHREGMPLQTQRQLEALGIPVDTTPYVLSFEDTVEYLAGRVGEYDVVVACQNVPDVGPALRLASLQGTWTPPLIEHGGLVAEAASGSRELAARYVGVCATIRDAAAARMPGREHHALEIPSLVDLEEFDPAGRADVRAELGLSPEAPVFGWVGRLDRKKRVEDFIHAAAMVCQRVPGARFLVIGGPDAFMPEYAAELRALAAGLGLEHALSFLGDRADVPRLLSALDAMVWLARDEGMPHVIAEAGAARLPVVATRDNGTLEQIEDGVSGRFVPHADVPAIAAAMAELAADEGLRRRLGEGLRATVERRFSTSVVVPQWEALFREVAAERPRPGREGSSTRPLSASRS
jgi:glycosyltransferase involved in cell wall biosynthesis